MQRDRVVEGRRGPGAVRDGGRHPRVDARHVSHDGVVRAARAQLGGRLQGPEHPFVAALALQRERLHLRMARRRRHAKLAFGAVDLPHQPRRAARLAAAVVDRDSRAAGETPAHQHLVGRVHRQRLATILGAHDGAAVRHDGRDFDDLVHPRPSAARALQLAGIWPGSRSFNAGDLSGTVSLVAGPQSPRRQRGQGHPPSGKAVRWPPIPRLPAAGCRVPVQDGAHHVRRKAAVVAMRTVEKKVWAQGLLAAIMHEDGRAGVC
jgi:hypothetical protein